MGRLHMAELREGVWLRPDNLGGDRLPDERRVLGDQCLSFDSVPKLGFESTEVDLAAELWDLDGWADTATELRRRMHEVTGRLQDGATGSLPDGFVLSATVLRHLGVDPLLPRELLPRHWPGARIRAEYDRYDLLYREVLAAWVLDSVSAR